MPPMTVNEFKTLSFKVGLTVPSQPQWQIKRRLLKDKQPYHWPFANFGYFKLVCGNE